MIGCVIIPLSNQKCNWNRLNYLFVVFRRLISAFGKWNTKQIMSLFRISVHRMSLKGLYTFKFNVIAIFNTYSSIENFNLNNSYFLQFISKNIHANSCLILFPYLEYVLLNWINFQRELKFVDTKIKK